MTREFFTAMWGALGGGTEVAERVDFVDPGELPSVFAVSDLAAAAVGTAGAAIAELIGMRFGELLVPEVTLGKRCARLDLRDPAARAHFDQLLRRAHVLVHGYRADALVNLGLDPQTRHNIRPGLIDVSLNAYGRSGPWHNRRGFDSLVQMSTGIADLGMRLLEKDRPTPLPVQALDHATGYLMAAAAIRGVTHRLSSDRGFRAQASLARTAELLVSGPKGKPLAANVISATDADWAEAVEPTQFGPAHRLRPPVQIGQAPMRWERPAVELGSSPADW